MKKINKNNMFNVSMSKSYFIQIIKSQLWIIAQCKDVAQTLDTAIKSKLKVDRKRQGELELSGVSFAHSQRLILGHFLHS